MSLKDQLEEKPETGFFILPGGYFAPDGSCFKEVKIRQLTGKEEEIVIGLNLQVNIPELLTQILANCIENIGPIKEIDPIVIQKLLICDRDYILLKLRQMTFGDMINANIHCPNDICGKEMEIDFDLKNIEIDRKDIGNGIFLHTLSSISSYKDQSGIVHSDVEFRLPTIGDQEQIVKIYGENQSKALTLLLAKCIKRIGSITLINENLVQSLSINARREINQKMQEVSPKVDLFLNIQCPECEYKFATPFDIQNFFLAK